MLITRRLLSLAGGGGIDAYPKERVEGLEVLAKTHFGKSIREMSSLERQRLINGWY